MLPIAMILCVTHLWSACVWQPLEGLLGHKLPILVLEVMSQCAKKDLEGPTILLEAVFGGTTSTVMIS